MSKQRRINPFKDISATHNKGIGTVWSGLIADGGPITQKKIHDLTVKFLASQKITNERLSVEQVERILSQMANGSMDQSISQLLASKNVPAALIALAQEAEDINENQSLESAFEQLTSIERNILQSDFTDQEIQYPLLYIAITKGSLKYWMDKINNPAKYEEPIFATPPMAIIVAKADGKGALIGTGFEIIAVIVESHFGWIGVAGSAIEKSVETYHKEHKKRKRRK